MSFLASYRAGLLLTLLAAASPAQDYRGRIQGTVRDTSDAVIAAIMQEHGLTHLASNDADFDRVPGIARYSPL